MIIGIMGAPCTGKSVLSKGLCHKMAAVDYSVELVQEYATDFIRKYGAPKDISDQLKIVRKQLELENLIPAEIHIVTECPLPLCLMYGIRLVDYTNSRDLMYLNDFTAFVNKNLRRYNVFFYLPPEFPPQENGTRIHLSEEEQTGIDLQIRGFLDLYELSYFEIKGDYYERLEQCIKIVKKIEESNERN
jgi:hypothetical protein